MALDLALQTLSERLDNLEERLRQTFVAVSQDYPDVAEKGDEAGVLNPVLRLSESCSDLRGRLAETRLAAAEAERAAGYPADLGRVWRELLRIHTQLIRVNEQLHSELLAYEHLHELVTIELEHGRAWRGWARVVRRLLGEVQNDHYQAEYGALHCWRELCERLAERGISLSTISIGQKISLPDTGVYELEDAL